jgi:hypothetical protein
MSHAEFRSWIDFYRAFPFDDYARYHRPAALIAGSIKRLDDVGPLLDWLQPQPGPAASELTDADERTLRAFGFRARRS